MKNFLKVIPLIGLLLLGGFAVGNVAAESSRERQTMVKDQLERRGIQSERVLAAMKKVKRDQFVSEMQKDRSYADSPLPIGYGQTISQPYIVAYMTEALDLKKTDRVLEIGTGSGYQAAILAELAGEVYSIEIVAELGEQARKLLTKLGYENIHLKVGDGYKGWPEHAPFDAIIVTAAPPEVPQALIDQLKPDGGRMIIPVGVGYQELQLLRKTKSGLSKERLIPVRFVPMVKSKETVPGVNAP